MDGMKQLLVNLQQERVRLADASADYEQRKKDFEEMNKDLIEKIEKSNEIISKLQDEIRSMAVDEYTKTGSKHFDGGVDIRVVTKYKYDEDAALSWAKEHDMCLKLDKHGIKKVAKSGQVSFVEVVEEPIATIPTDIKFVDFSKVNANE